jgi:hypothetical protein
MSGSIIPSNSHNWGSGLGFDIWNHITNYFTEKSEEGYTKDFIALSCAWKDLSLWIPEFVSRLSPEAVEKLCGSRLQIINLSRDIHPARSPLIAVRNLFDLFIGYQTLRRIAGKDGAVGLLIQPQGFTSKQLQETAANKEPPVKISLGRKCFAGFLSADPIAELLNSISTESLKVSLIAFPPASMGMDYPKWHTFAESQGCGEIPDILQCIAFCALGEHKDDILENAQVNKGGPLEWRSSQTPLQQLGGLGICRDLADSALVFTSQGSSQPRTGTAIGRELTAAKIDSSWQTFLSDYPIDIGEKVLRLLKARDFISIACVNSSCHRWLPECASIISLATLQEMLGPTFREINMVDGSPPFDFDRFGVIKAWETVVPQIYLKEKAGMTLLALPQGLTIRKFVNEIAPKIGVEILYYPEDFKLYADIALETQQVIVITNSTFTQNAAKKAGCEVPEALAYLVNCVLTYEKYKICLYESYNSCPSIITSTPLSDGECVGVNVRDRRDALFPFNFYIGNPSPNDETAGFRRV